MSVLFLDPFAIGPFLALVVYVWLVWRGVFRSWFGRPDAWTIVAWPVPLLAIVVAPLAGFLTWVAGRLGVEVGTGEMAGAAVYGVAYLAPTVLLTVWPPRWLVPRWARARITQLPAAGSGTDVPVDAVPAVQGVRGHGSRARWVWRVDGLPGHVWVDEGHLHFRTVADPDAVATPELGIDEDMLAELRSSFDGDELRLESPQGGWWSRGRLDVALPELDRIRVRSTVPWRRDGLITFEVEGRRPSELWVADIRHLQSQLSSRGEGRTDSAGS